MIYIYRTSEKIIKEKVEEFIYRVWWIGLVLYYLKSCINDSERGEKFLFFSIFS